MLAAGRVPGGKAGAEVEVRHRPTRRVPHPSGSVLCRAHRRDRRGREAVMGVVVGLRKGW